MDSKVMDLLQKLALTGLVLLVADAVFDPFEPGAVKTAAKPLLLTYSPQQL